MTSPLIAADAAAHATLRARGVDPRLWTCILPAILSSAERIALEDAFDAAHRAYTRTVRMARLSQEAKT